MAQQDPPARTAPQTQTPYQPATAKSNTVLIIAIVMIAVVVDAVIGGILLFGAFNTLSSTTTQRSLNIINGLITVQPGQYNGYTLTIPSGASSVVVNGTFTHPEVAETTSRSSSWTRQITLTGPTVTRQMPTMTADKLRRIPLARIFPAEEHTILSIPTRSRPFPARMFRQQRTYTIEPNDL